VNWLDSDSIDRTAKILIDAEKVTHPDEAARFLNKLVLQVDVGSGIESDPAGQAALLTVVNAGRRAFKGGVHVRLESDPPLTTGWTAGMSASTTVEHLGGQVVDCLTREHPTLAITNPCAPIGRPVLFLTWQGWSAGVVESAEDLLPGDGNALSGIASAALGVSEVFQQQLGAVAPGRRDVGLSLWRPDLSWRNDEAAGPVIEYLPARVWLLGLGHLGQAYAWTLGMLSFAVPEEVEIGLVDFDVVVNGNTATQLLVAQADVGLRKTRVVAAALEGLGIRARLVERAFDEHFHPYVHANPYRNEPTIALAGFHDGPPRRLLGRAGFTRIVDGGLGSGPVEYLDIVVHTFPGPESTDTAFAEQTALAPALPAAYKEEIQRRIDAGVEESAARCGVLDVAGVTVGAAFVGALTGALTVADLVRELHDGPRYSVLHVDLRQPSDIRAVPNSAPVPPIAAAYTRAR
jgi:hypothetical protein